MSSCLRYSSITMWLIFASVLLIFGGIKADMCEHSPICSTYDVPKHLPTTLRGFKSECREFIKLTKCQVDVTEQCYPPESRDEKYLARSNKNLLRVAREICSARTLLHAGFVNNLKCFSEFFSGFNTMKGGCSAFHERPDLVRSMIKDLKKEGLLPTHYKDNLCISHMNTNACLLMKVERKCGTNAMEVIHEVMQKIGPSLIVGPRRCRKYVPLFNDVIRLRREELKKGRMDEAKGILPSDCNEHNKCQDPQVMQMTPETEEDLQHACKLFSEFMKCELSYYEKCFSRSMKSHSHDYQIRKNAYHVAQAVCLEGLLHAVVVDNLRCMSRFKNEVSRNGKSCFHFENTSEFRVPLIDFLVKEGVVGDLYAYNQNECLDQMTGYSCVLLELKEACGNAAMHAGVEIVMGLRSASNGSDICEHGFDSFPGFIQHLISININGKTTPTLDGSQWLGQW